MYEKEEAAAPCDSYVAFDLETTGLSPVSDRILEIGAVRVINGKAEDTFETFVFHGLAVPERITALTGITTEMTEGAPGLKEAVDGFLAFAGDAVLLGHNLMFDYSFMKNSVVRLGGSFERAGLDTLTIARTCLPQLPGRSLDQVAAHFGVSQGHHHRALDDARTAAGIYQHMLQEFAGTCPELFVPSPLLYRARREAPATAAQKNYLRDLIKYHGIKASVPFEQLTKSEASRLIDGILSQYGRMGTRM